MAARREGQQAEHEAKQRERRDVVRRRHRILLQPQREDDGREAAEDRYDML